MNQQRAKKIGAVYYKDLKTKFSPGDVAIDPSNGKVTKFPSDLKKFAAFCDKLYGGYFVKVKLTASIKEALFVETRLAELEAETDKYEDKQYKLREKMMNMVTKGQTEIICVFMNRNGDEMVTVEEVTKAIGQDKLLSLGRRYNDKHRCLWVALVETKGFADNKSYYALSRSYTQKLSTTGYKPGDKFNDDMGLIIFNHGKKLKEPLDMYAIRAAERKKKEAAEKRAEAKKWKNVKTYDDKKEKPERTKIFAYKGILGMVTHPGAAGVIAKPEKGNLGVVIEAKHCDITPEAKQMFQHARREGGSFAAIQLTGGDNPCIGWLGGYQMACEARDIEIGRDCDKSTLDKMNLVEVPNMTFPKSFIEYVDKQTAKK